MATNKKLDPALAETVERVLEDLMTGFEAAEEQLESRTDLPEISPETEASLLREIEADLDRYYPRTTEPTAEGARPFGETVEQMVTWLRVSGSEMLDRISELILPKMPGLASVRSGTKNDLTGISSRRSKNSEDPRAADGIDLDTLRELAFVPVSLERFEPNANRLVLRYFGSDPAPSAPPKILVFLDQKPLEVEIDSNLPNQPPVIDLIWEGGPVNLRQIGRMKNGSLVVDLSSVST